MCTHASTLIESSDNISAKLPSFLKQGLALVGSSRGGKRYLIRNQTIFPQVLIHYSTGGRKLLLEGTNENVSCGFFVVLVLSIFFSFFFEGFFFFCMPSPMCKYVCPRMLIICY